IFPNAHVEYDTVLKNKPNLFVKTFRSVIGNWPFIIIDRSRIGWYKSRKQIQQLAFPGRRWPEYSGSRTSCNVERNIFQYRFLTITKVDPLQVYFTFYGSGNRPRLFYLRGLQDRTYTLVGRSGLGDYIAHKSDDQYRKYQKCQITVKGSKITQGHTVDNHIMPSQQQ